MHNNKTSRRSNSEEATLIDGIVREMNKIRFPSERELAAAGRKGLLKAHRNYRPSKGDFAKYAGLWIRNSMKICVLKKN